MLEPLAHGEEMKNQIINDSPRIKTKTSKTWKAAIIANVKDYPSIVWEDTSPEIVAEYDDIKTVNDIKSVIESHGHRATFIPADTNLAKTLIDQRPDICFNIAEGSGGESREAQVPALLEYLRIPYTGSRVLANAVSLNKVFTKRIWRDNGLFVTPFQEFVSGDEELQVDLEFPLFVKPSREGASMGVEAASIIHNEHELREYTRLIISKYKQPALVETYLPGREFTVGLIGNTQNKRHPDFYNHQGFHFFPISEVDTNKSLTPGVYSKKLKKMYAGHPEGVQTLCPASIDFGLQQKLYSLALRAHEAIGALDFSRTDLRLDARGEPVLMEINTIPGLSRDFSDLCLQTKAEGIAYSDLILEIFYLGATRWGLLSP